MIVALALALQVALVPGTTSTYTDGTNTWAGNPYCAQAGVILQQGSPAIDAGVVVPGVHCSHAGPCTDEGLQEWYGAAPDIGACEFVTSVVVVPPAYPIVLNVNPPPEEATVKVDATPAGNTAMLTVRMYDADNPGEGELWINGNGPLRLFDDMVDTTMDATGHYANKDGLVADVQFATPASWWINGTNALRFVHLASQGFRIEAQPTVQFGGALVVPAAPTNLGVQ